MVYVLRLLGCSLEKGLQWVKSGRNNNSQSMNAEIQVKSGGLIWRGSKGLSFQIQGTSCKKSQ